MCIISSSLVYRPRAAELSLYTISLTRPVYTVHRCEFKASRYYCEIYLWIVRASYQTVDIVNFHPVHLLDIMNDPSAAYQEHDSTVS